ncbi:MAG: hypothetical protein HGB37_03950 [Candidatus Moranbacteria bacterium]|nr:hypothetical protein [Candidatus Moranbacteria bacterium]NTW90031.1 hypothetical protein [Candidatus Moranbacteria bacterium]
MIRSKASRVALVVLLSVLAFSFLPDSVSAAGLVPCGDASTPCALCHFITGIANIITRIRDVMFFIGLAIITAMGIVYIVSGGNPKLIETAKNGIKNTLIGIIFILFAWFIVNMVMFYIFSANDDLGVGAQLKGANGYEFSCNATSRSGQMVAGTGGTATGTPVTGTPGTGSGYYSCNQGSCPASSSIANAVKSNTGGIEANFMMAIIQGGEGCNKSSSSAGACGYSQVTAPGRRKVCGLTGTDAETCAALQNNIQLDINCGAAMLKDFKRYSICNANGLKSLAGCYNAGLTGSCGENNYCVRVMNYYNSC